jgi:homoserine acetyltransferase
MTLIATTPGHRRYLVRSAGTAAQLFTVEATDKEEAMRRAILVASTISLTASETTLVIEESSAVLHVPNFLEGYFAMRSNMAKQGQSGD